MPRVKKAEQALIDSKKAFPLDECKAKIARRWGLNAVALSGPCQGAALADCVCNQLNDRWESINDRFAGNKDKVVKLAMKLAETLSKNDDTDRCEEYLSKEMKFEKNAAKEVTQYLRAYAMDDMMKADFGQMMDEVETEHDVSDLADEVVSDEEQGLGSPESSEVMTEEVDLVDPQGQDEQVEVDMSVEPEGDMDMEGGLSDAPQEETVNLEVPKEFAEQILESLQSQLGGEGDLDGLPSGGEIGTTEEGLDGLDGVADPEGEEGLDGLDEPAQESLDGLGDPSSEGLGEPAAPEAGIPGKPEELQQPGKSVTVSDETSTCKGCGSTMAAAPVYEIRKVEPGQAHGHPEGETSEQYEKHEENETPAEEKLEHEEGKELEDEHKEGHEEMTDKGEEREESESEESEEKEGKDMKEASAKKTTKVAQADEQEVGHKKIPAKEKGVEDPKPINEGNLEQEGYSANGKKFQDGTTMKNEQKFDAKEVNRSEITGGQASILGKDESYPEGKASVPAGSAPIKNEELTGGDVSTKGTIIASIRPEGILVTAPDGKKFLAKASIHRTNDTAMKAIQEAIESVKFDGDAKKFAANALRAAKKAHKAVNVTLNDSGMRIASPFESVSVESKVSNLTENIVKEISQISFNGDIKAYAEAALAILKKAKCVEEDGCLKTDTSKLEAEKFTNDGEKKPDDGGATSKGNGKKPDSEKGQVKIDTGKKEGDEFTNKGEKEAEAATNKTTKQAADKKVEDPKPISEGNLTQEGFPNGECKFQDGKTMGNEEKFDAAEVKKSDVSAGDKSLMGNEEPAAKEGPKVPAGGPALGNEELTGGDLSTKGTIIANNQPNSVSSEVREARLKAASAYVADLLRNGEIGENEYNETLEKYAKMPVQAIQALAASTRVARQRAMNAIKVNAEKQGNQKTAGICIPIVVASSSNEKSLKDKLVEAFKLTNDLNNLDEMEK